MQVIRTQRTMDSLKTIKLTVKGQEQDIIEGLLNCWYSGGDKNLIHFCLFIVALSKRWEGDKLIYYNKLFEEKNG